MLWRNIKHKILTFVRSYLTNFKYKCFIVNKPYNEFALVKQNKIYNFYASKLYLNTNNILYDFLFYWTLSNEYWLQTPNRNKYLTSKRDNIEAVRYYIVWISSLLDHYNMYIIMQGFVITLMGVDNESITLCYDLYTWPQ